MRGVPFGAARCLSSACAGCIPLLKTRQTQAAAVVPLTGAWGTASETHEMTGTEQAEAIAASFFYLEFSGLSTVAFCEISEAPGVIVGDVSARLCS
jgi:hypothetical protein